MNRYLKRTALSVAVSAIVGLPVSGTVLAQDESLALEVVIVSARKVEESIQDVALSVTAFTSEDLKRRSIEELDDVALLTPGLSYEDFSNGGFGTPIIRGAAQFDVTALEQNVSTFIDGVYIPRNYAIDVGTIGLERVEVVKGPQSALYGANAFQGAITFTSVKANPNEFEGNVGVTVGSDGRQDFNASVNIPVIEDKLGVRLAGGTSDFDGDYDNIHPLTAQASSRGTDESIGGWDNESYSVSIVAQPTEAVRADLGYQSFDVLSESKAQSRLELGDFNCGNLGGFGAPQFLGFCGDLPETPLDTSGNPTGFEIDPRGFGLDAKTEITRFALAADLSDSLSVSYVFGNVEGEVFSAGNADRDSVTGQFFGGTFFNAFTVLPVGGFDYDSHELKLEFKGESGFYGMIGLYVLDGTDVEAGATALLLPVGVPIAPIDANSLATGFTLNVVDTTTVTKSTSVFARISMPFLDDKLVISAEGRFSDDDRSVDNVYFDGALANPFDETYFVPRLTVDFNLTDDNLLYLSAAEGQKSGGSNAEIGASVDQSTSLVVDEANGINEREFGAEENTTIELGSKNTFMDGRLQLNAALYLTEWDDLQVSQAAINGGFFATSIIGNLGAATLQGLELDVNFAATEGITLNAGLALNDATYDDGVISQRLDRAGICDDIVCRAGGEIGGNSLPRSSDTQWNIGAQFDGTAGNDVEFYLRADLVGQSEQFVSEANIGTIPSRTLLNLRGGVTYQNWSADLWVKNATDEQYVSNAFYIASPFARAIVPTSGDLRRFGLDINYSF